MPLIFRDWTRRIRDRLGVSVREAPTAAGAPLPDARVAGAIAVGAALLFVILSPVGTDRLPAPVRLGYWLAALLGGSAIGVAITRWLWRWPPIARHPALGCLVAGVLLTPPISILVTLANRLAFGLPVDSATQWLAILPPVFGLSCALSLVNVWAARGRMAASDDAAPPEDGEPPEAPSAGLGADQGEALFRARLPDGFKTADLWALEAEDHYLRVHMSSGRALILMRLSDAMAALARLDGAQTHRSWWVARSAAKAIETSQGRAAVTLPDGTRAPVSRSYYRALKSRGWL